MYRVLIVEDDPQIAKINAEYLREAGFEVAGNAENAAKAMELLESTPIQLMLLDIYLPGGNGLQLLRKVRENSQQIDVIVISAAKDSAKIREAFRIGCIDYIIKPFTSERLGIALRKYEQKMELLRKDFLEQNEVDLLSSRQAAESEDALWPKGIDRKTLHMIFELVSKKTQPFSVADIAQETQISRVSAKKYLDFLCDDKVLRQTYVYGNKGRPANLYQFLSAGQLAIPEEETAENR